MFIVLIACLLHLVVVIHSYVMIQDIEIKCTKNINNVLNQNVNVTKRDGSQHLPSDRRQFILTSAVNGNV